MLVVEAAPSDFDAGAATGAHRVGLAFVAAAPRDEEVLQSYIARLPPADV